MGNRNTVMSIAKVQEIPEKYSRYAGDLQMAQDIAAGNRALFKDLYDRNSHALFNLARRMTGATAEAEDVVQEAFIRAYQKINLFAGRSTLSSWLYRICINVGLEHLRRKKGTFEDITDSNCGVVEPNQKKLILRRAICVVIRNGGRNDLPICAFLLSRNSANFSASTKPVRLAVCTSKSFMFSC